MKPLHPHPTFLKGYKFITTIGNADLYINETFSESWALTKGSRKEWYFVMYQSMEACRIPKPVTDVVDEPAILEFCRAYYALQS